MSIVFSARLKRPSQARIPRDSRCSKHVPVGDMSLLMFKEDGGVGIMDFLVVAIPWLLVGASGGNYRMKKKRQAGLEPSHEGEIMIFVWDTLWGPLTWFSMFRL